MLTHNKLLDNAGALKHTWRMNKLTTANRAQIMSALVEGNSQTLRVTPAMESGIADHVWSIEEIVELLDSDVLRSVA